MYQMLPEILKKYMFIQIEIEFKILFVTNKKLTVFAPYIFHILSGLYPRTPTI